MGNFHETSARADVGIAAVGRNAGYGRRFFDAYTYLCRGKVFANAQTGNIVLFGANIAEGNWLRAAEYFLPILAFALGVVAAGDCQAAVQKRQSDINIHWRQIVVLVEIVLLDCSGIPAADAEYHGQHHDLVHLRDAGRSRSASCAAAHLQPTMCTGNLRSGTEQVCNLGADRRPECDPQTRNYYSIILFLSLAVRLAH